MATLTYRDFVLTAGSTLSGPAGLPASFAVSIFDSPVGQGEVEERVQIPPDLSSRLDALVARKLDADPAAQIALGTLLAEMLLPSLARAMFTASLAALDAGQGLRLRLRLSDELAAIPWEYAYWHGMRGEHTASGFLALDTRLSLVRELALPFPPDVEPSAPASRRVLVVMASPAGLAPLPGLAAEQASLRTALQAIPGLKAVYLPTFAPHDTPGRVTLSALADALLLQPRTDIFHFSGHGVFSPAFPPAGDAPAAPGMGRLALEDEHGELAALSADRLCELLRSHGVRLVFLNACQSGARDPHAVWNSLAAGVLKARIPAVVAMQTKVRDDVAAAFSATFYRALVAGYELDYAVSAGRMAMRSAAGGDAIDWGVPVLYARGAGGVLFRPIEDEAARLQAGHDLPPISDVQVTQNIGQVFGPVIGELHGSLGDLNFFATSSPDSTPQEPPAPGSTSVCPACRAANPPGARFCELCGAGLPRACAHCGGALSSTAKFCPACGRRAENF